MSRIRKAEEKGELFELRFQVVIQKIVDKKDWILLKDIHLPSRTSFSQIDFLLLTPYGYFCIETKDWNCAIYCADSAFWKVKYPSRVFNVLSPVQQNNAHIHALNKYIPGYRLRGIICFSEDCRLINQKRDMVMNLSEFVSFLERLDESKPIITQEELIRDFELVIEAHSECLSREGS